MRQLRCFDLNPGDIMLKVTDYGSAFAKPAHRFLERSIRNLQAKAGGINPNVAHAGLMFDSYYIIEAQSKGISPNDLRVQNRDIGYLVFRCKDENIARGAATCAKMLMDIHKAPRKPKHARSLVGAASVAVGRATQQLMRGGVPNVKGPMVYSWGGALGSLKNAGSGGAKTRDEMEDLLDDILAGKASPFFCSQFVVYVYQYVAEQFGLTASTLFPGSDAKVHPSMLATRLVANPQFTEAGYMIAGER
jgi:hypothetical protein